MEKPNKTIQEVLAELPNPEDDSGVIKAQGERATILGHLEDLVKQASVAAGAQRQAEQDLSGAVVTDDKRRLADAESRLDAALAQRQRLVARARALEAAVVRVDLEEQRAWSAAGARCRTEWNKVGAEIRTRHDQAVAAVETSQTEISIFGNGFAVLSRPHGRLVAVKFVAAHDAFRVGDTAGFLPTEAAALVKGGFADYSDQWRQDLALLAVPGLAEARSAARAERNQPTAAGPVAHLRGSGPVSEAAIEQPLAADGLS